MLPRLNAVFVSVGLPVDRSGDPRLTTGDGIAEVAGAAEAAGIGAVFVTDHPAPDVTWLASGGHPTLDPFVALSFAAAATTTLRVHTNLLVLGYRNPFLAAKAVATLDVLSGGRTIVGVGVGYLEAEFAALGADYDRRGELADEALETMIEAWRAEPVDHRGATFTARETVVDPAPTQRPHPPLWVGGNSQAAMRRAVAHGTVWAPMPSPRGSAATLGTPAMPDIADLAAGVVRLHELSTAAGRTDPPGVAAIPRSVQSHGDPDWSAEALRDEIGALTEAGATELVVNLPGRSPGQVVDQIGRLRDVLDRR
jgi:probable F420-dependent oxidoreductase